MKVQFRNTSFAMNNYSQAKGQLPNSEKTNYLENSTNPNNSKQVNFTALKAKTINKQIEKCGKVAEDLYNKIGELIDKSIRAYQIARKPGATKEQKAAVKTTRKAVKAAEKEFKNLKPTQS